MKYRFRIWKQSYQSWNISILRAKKVERDGAIYFKLGKRMIPYPSDTSCFYQIRNKVYADAVEKGDKLQFFQIKPNTGGEWLPFEVWRWNIWYKKVALLEHTKQKWYEQYKVLIATGVLAIFFILSITLLQSSFESMVNVFSQWYLKLDKFISVWQRVI